MRGLAVVSLALAGLALLGTARGGQDPVPDQPLNTWVRRLRLGPDPPRHSPVRGS